MATDTQIASRDQIGRRQVLRTIGIILLQLLMTAILVSFLIPTLWMISSSLKATTEVFVHPIKWIPSDPQWKNYAEVFKRLPFAKFAWNTLIVTGGAVLGTIFSSITVGYSFARLKWPGRNFFFALMVATMLLPEVITLIPRFILFRQLDWIDTFLPLIVPYWCGATSLYIFLVHQFFRGIPIELEEAALIDGANRFQILSQILVPLSKPVIATVGVFALIQHYNEFLTPLIYLNSMDNWVMALGVRALNDSNAANWELVFAASTLMLIPVLILFIFAQRYFVQGITMTGFGGR
ncbi:MAG: carbohydrate ABC transporter permease [Anaerolineales bacterium]|nr:carbohydrate ABC transporter permease [Anaerolineales bacterium]